MLWILSIRKIQNQILNIHYLIILNEIFFLIVPFLVLIHEMVYSVLKVLWILEVEAIQVLQLRVPIQRQSESEVKSKFSFSHQYKNDLTSGRMWLFIVNTMADDDIQQVNSCENSPTSHNSNLYMPESSKFCNTRIMFTFVFLDH